MADSKHRRFRLAFVNAAEDIPRLIRAYGRACFGEFALVLRPADGRGVMVRLTKEGAWMWRAGETDAAVLPDIAIDAKDAVALVKTEQKAVPKPGSITLRGQWSGYLHCDDGVPRVELTRKLASYGLLRLTSTPTVWTWTIERTAKWFSQPGSDSGTESTLVGAIQAGLARSMGLLGEACSTRDSHRRAALDESWAVTHPIRPAKEAKDPTERLKPKEPRTKAAAPPRVDAPVALPDAPATPAGVARMAQEIAQEADALASLRDVSWIWHDSSALHDAIPWFREVGLEDIADELASYDSSPDHPPERLVERLRKEVEGEGLDEDTRKKAIAALGTVEEGFRTAPLRARAGAQAHPARGPADRDRAVPGAGTQGGGPGHRARHPRLRRGADGRHLGGYRRSADEGALHGGVVCVGSSKGWPGLCCGPDRAPHAACSRHPTGRGAACPQAHAQARGKARRAHASAGRRGSSDEARPETAVGASACP